MSESEELVALVALLRYGSFRTSQMALRQRLIDGDSPTLILAEDPNSRLIYDRAVSDVDQWITSGERPLSWLDSDYPQQLREVHDFPPVIFVRGKLAQPDNGICIVGSRKAGQAALEAAAQIAHLVVDKNWTVVSGLAEGIDTAAHVETLKLGGRTVAVIGNGIDYYYPPKNRGLQHAIEDRGLVISQFWPGTTPKKYSFPMRNAVMSAYASATIIVSAKEHSGTRHQAKQAAAHGRPLVVSRAVYENTTWARKLVDDPNVLARVAYSTEESVSLAMEMATFTISELTLL
ncbi:MAG: DNA-processing protein DprA [Varibaculum cambriense]|uniref:DNA-processing protein DprA n=1 Tax=Varibaculum cambriense TaxID=184870 RepID=UPI00290D38BE|nr:DNA-processing protein DprA [Varibaculum cambriense]MDU4944312.1 DNA-processing protein DprA [Varibaculum cambriense]